MEIDGRGRPLPGPGLGRAAAEGPGDAGVTELLSREPSLEELFLAQYGEDGRSARARRVRCRLTSPSATGCTGTIARHGGRPADCPQGRPLRSPVGLHLRRLHRLVGDQLHDALQDPGANATPWRPPTARTRRRARSSDPPRSSRPSAGFTVFKISMTLIILGAVWGLLTSTRLLRGEEDNGRWDSCSPARPPAGAPPPRRSPASAPASLMLWAVTAIITVLTGLDSSVDIAVGPALYFALAMVATAVMFLAVGALTSQLAATRRQAASFAAAFLGVSYAVRMIADAGVGLHGLIWASPLGWVEELQPLTAPQPLALVPIVVFTAVAGRRRRAPRRHPRRRGEHRAGPGARRAASPAALRARPARRSG